MSGPDPSRTLPVASIREVRAYARRLALQQRGDLVRTLLLHALAAVAGLVTPRLLGGLVEDAASGRADIPRAVLAILAAVVGQAVLTRFALFASRRLGETVLARLREEFVDRVLALPTRTVERVGTGDLVTRTTRDIDVLALTVQRAVPDTLVAATTIALTIGAVALVDPLLVLPGLVAVPVLAFSTRWYLRRARAGYLRSNASYSRLTDTLSETVTGARTVDTYRLAGRRLRRTDEDIAESYAAERHTLYLRSVYLPIADTGYILPVATTLVAGGLMYVDGRVGLAAVITATLYMQQIVAPVDLLLFWMDELQVGGASLARILGVRSADGDDRTGPASGTSTDHPARGVSLRRARYGYRDGRDVLRGIDLHISPGERVTVVGPSGAGKSTLGRLVAGIHPPDSGVVALDGVPLDRLSPTELRRDVVLVTQEYHVFGGTLADNLRIARPDASPADLERALRAVGAWDWASEVGLDRPVGAGATPVSPAQAQQLALARLVLRDPSVAVLDEATALIDPRTARLLERSLNELLSGTIVSIAHRLHTAYDADRVVLMGEGRIVEMGTHQELLAQGGSYADLWRSWHGGAPGDARPPTARIVPAGRERPAPSDRQPVGPVDDSHVLVEEDPGRRRHER